MNLYKASKQWMSRPPDERFSSIEDLYNATVAYAQTAFEANTNLSDLRAEARDGEIVLIGKENVPAQLTNWSFGQLAARAQGPATYLRRQPATLAAQNLNWGLKAAATLEPERPGTILLHRNGGYLCRAITTEVYQRFWNWEVAERLLALEAAGWIPATPTALGEPDLLTPGVNSALYASDHDMFAFIRHRDKSIQEAGEDKGLFRGMIIENSEVGKSSLRLTRFLYRYMCGNHIVWDVSELSDVAIRHVGNVGQKLHEWELTLSAYANESALEQETVINNAISKRIAATKEEVLDRLFNIRKLDLSRRVLEQGYDAVEPDQDGDPTTVWGMVNGLTRYSQTIPYADQRDVVDRAAGKLLRMRF